MALNTLKNGKENIKSWGAKTLAVAGLFSVLSLGTPAEAQTTTKQQVKTEQVEKQNTPDYMGQAPDKLKEFYPEEVEYFKPIFQVVGSVWPKYTAMINKIVSDTLEEHKWDIKSEKDRWTIVLMFTELAYPATDFTKKTMKLDENWVDKRQIIANEILKAVGKKAKEEHQKAQEKYEQTEKKYEQTEKEYEQTEKEYEQTEKEYAKVQDENARIQEKRKETQENFKKVEAEWKEVQKQMDASLEGMEHVMEELDVHLVTKNTELHSFLRQYDKMCKENNRKPTQKALELLNQLPEYIKNPRK